MSFVHLKSYSEFSLTEGINTTSDLTKAAKTNNMPALAITDKNALFGSVNFYKYARDKGIKGIIGLDATIEQDDGNLYQLTLLAKNQDGYKKLVTLNSRAYTDNRKSDSAYIKEEWLEELSDVIILSGAKNGLIGKNILEGKTEVAKQIAEQMQSFFKDDFYIELQRDGSSEETEYMEGAVNICQELNIPPVATHPIFFNKEEDFLSNETKFCISNKYKLFDFSRPTPFNKNMYFKSSEEMEELFADIPEAIENTVQIAKKCNTEILLGKNFLPRFSTPNEETESEYFEHLAKDGLQKRLEKKFSNGELIESEENIKKYYDRLSYEMNIIKQMEFPGYFLIVSDFINWAKSNDIPIGPGRGSGAGSLVAYSMGITDLDPLPYNLLFERFLNPERVSMPDFDIDMCQERRGEIIEYVKKKYGEEAVCQIGTFGTMASKSVIRDVGRTLDYPYSFVDEIAKMVNVFPDTISNKPHTLREFLFGDEDKGFVGDPKLLERYNKDQEVKKMIDIALTLEGLTRNIGTHASGVLISPTKLTDFTPVYTIDDKSPTVSQFDMKDVESAGLVKFDFLGLGNLTIIQNAIKIINFNRNENDKFDIREIKIDDKEVYRNIFANGNTTSIFQFESNGMKGILQKAKPTSFEELTALNALYRPGPMEIIPSYIEAKFQKPEQREYPHPLLKTALEETYGFMVYQEQVMECAKVIAGYSLGGADLLRRAMGKKKPEEMKKQREIFVQGSSKNGVSEEKANELFDLIDKFSGYGFNKSHAAAYSYVAYQTAYLKHYYPSEFLTANFNSNLDKTDKIAILLNDCKNNNINILPPDINHSLYGFNIESQNNIRYGLGAIKGAGEKAISFIVKNREENGPFKDFWDFIERVGSNPVNKKVLESLIKAGAFDSLEPNRAMIFDSLETITTYASAFKKKNAKSLLAALEPKNDTTEEVVENKLKKIKVKKKKEEVPLERPQLKETEPWDDLTYATMEKGALGIFFSINPYEDYYLAKLEGFKASNSLASLPELYNEGYSEAYIGGMIESINWWKSKKGAFVTITDGTSTTDIMMYESFLNENKEWLKKDAFVAAKLKLDKREDEENLLLSCKQGFSFEETLKLNSSKIFVASNSTNSYTDIQKFKTIVNKYKNNSETQIPIFLYGEDEKTKRKTNKLIDNYISYSPELINELKETFGDKWVKIGFARSTDDINFPEIKRKDNKKNYKSKNSFSI